MAKTSATMIEEMDKALAMPWYQVDRVGDYDLREEIEEAAEGFLNPEADGPGKREVRQAHQIFRRVHEKYTPDVQARFGIRLVRCPHCEREEAPDD